METAHTKAMVNTFLFQPGESRSFQPRHGARVAIVGAGLLGTTLALRYRQAGRLVTVFEAGERLERRGHSSIASRDRHVLALIEELGLSHYILWDKSRHSGARFGELAGGRGRILEALRDRARALDVDIRVGTAVRSILADRSGFGIDAGSDVGDFDEIVLTVPSAVASGMLSELPDRERLDLLDVDYIGVIKVSFLLEQAPGKRYVTQVRRGNERFVLIDPTTLADPDQTRQAVYVSQAVAANDPLFAADDQRLIEHYARALHGHAHILDARVTRTPHAFAQRQLTSFATSIPGLSIVNAAHLDRGCHYVERTAALAMSVFRTLCAEPVG